MVRIKKIYSKVKHLKRFNESSEELPYNKDLIRDMKELSLEYLDEGSILNYYIVSLDDYKMFYGGQYSHGEDRLNKYASINKPFKYVVMISDKPYRRKVLTSTRGVAGDNEFDQFIDQADYNKELSIELVNRLKEIYPEENIVAKGD